MADKVLSEGNLTNINQALTELESAFYQLLTSRGDNLSDSDVRDAYNFFNGTSLTLEEIKELKTAATSSFQPIFKDQGANGLWNLVRYARQLRETILENVTNLADVV